MEDGEGTDPPPVREHTEARKIMLAAIDYPIVRENIRC